MCCYLATLPMMSKLQCVCPFCIFSSKSMHKQAHFFKNKATPSAMCAFLQLIIGYTTKALCAYLFWLTLLPQKGKLSFWFQSKQIFYDILTSDFAMDQAEIDDWAKIAESMDGNGDTDSWFYLRARAIADGKPDPMPNVSQLMPESA